MRLAKQRKKASVMFIRVSLSILLAAATLAPAASDARPRPRDHDAAFAATQEGRFLPLPAIEARIVPQMRGFTYLGPELNAGRYRLKFMRGARLVWIDVDPRTGEVIGRSGF